MQKELLNGIEPFLRPEAFPSFDLIFARTPAAASGMGAANPERGFIIKLGIDHPGRRGNKKNTKPGLFFWTFSGLEVRPCKQASRGVLPTLKIHSYRMGITPWEKAQLAAGEKPLRLGKSHPDERAATLLLGIPAGLLLGEDNYGSYGRKRVEKDGIWLNKSK
ncbi:MAG: hypothetical protein IJ163_09675 [Bacteroidaceae bacterium]|nr:hypothetical protein [Bacteroidaceae bacterium]